jgi:hypothetical protein
VTLPNDRTFLCPTRGVLQCLSRLARGFPSTAAPAHHRHVPPNLLSPCCSINTGQQRTLCAQSRVAFFKSLASPSWQQNCELARSLDIGVACCSTYLAHCKKVAQPALGDPRRLLVMEWWVCSCATSGAPLAAEIPVTCMQNSETRLLLSCAAVQAPARRLKGRRAAALGQPSSSKNRFTGLRLTSTG